MCVRLPHESRRRSIGPRKRPRCEYIHRERIQCYVTRHEQYNVTLRQAHVQHDDEEWQYKIPDLEERARDGGQCRARNKSQEP